MAADKNKPGPAVARRQLRLGLRSARAEADMTQTQVAEALDWSPSKVMRIESGQSAVAVSDVIALISVYPNLADKRDEFLTLARDARRQTIASKYRDIYSSQFQEWLDYEAYADKIWQYEHQFVPGVLQLDEYAVPLAKKLLAYSDDRAERAAEARHERAEALVGTGGPALEIIVDETVLRRAIDEADAKAGHVGLKAQLSRIKRMNTVGRAALGEDIEPDLNPQISIRYVPLSKGIYWLMRQAFEIIQIPGDESESWMLYFERATGEEVVRDQYDEIADYIDHFADLTKSLAGPEATNKQIDRIIAELH